MRSLPRKALVVLKSSQRLAMRSQVRFPFRFTELLLTSLSGLGGLCFSGYPHHHLVDEA